MTAAKNLAASIRERLRQRALADRRPFDEVLTYYAMDRFLFRLGQTTHRDRFVLKGAMMLRLWGTTIARPTRDIDLLGRGDLAAGQLASAIADCIAAEAPPDALVFDVGSIVTSEIREQERYGGIRAEFQAMLERARIKMQVDVGLGDVITPRAVEVTYPTLLDFPAPKLHGYPVETAVAEKLEAIVDLGLANSRMKDFFDLWSIAGHLELDGATVAKAIGATFERRGTAVPTSIPVGLSSTFAADADRQKQWSAFVRRIRVDRAPSFADVVARIQRFAMPVFSAATGIAFDAMWTPTTEWATRATTQSTMTPLR